MENLKIKVIKMNEGAVIPKFAHTTDSGFDLYTSEDYVIDAKSTGAVPTGLKFELPEGFGLMVRPRSGNTLKGVEGIYEPMLDEFGVLIHSEKEKMDLKVQMGTVDQDYTGEVKILTTNNEYYPVRIPKGTKLAQCVIEKVYHSEFEIVNELKSTERGEKGFGSTGK